MLQPMACTTPQHAATKDVQDLLQQVYGLNQLKRAISSEILARHDPNPHQAFYLIHSLSYLLALSTSSCSLTKEKNFLSCVKNEKPITCLTSSELSKNMNCRLESK
jgi:hypothetical protein